jgi:hypothetical protein
VSLGGRTIREGEKDRIEYNYITLRINYRHKRVVERKRKD